MTRIAKPTLALALIVVLLAGCAPKEDNKAVAALKKEKNAWERESDQTANEATQAAEEAAAQETQAADEVQ